MLSTALQGDLVGADIFLIHPFQLAVDFLSKLDGVSVGQEARHDGGRDDEVRTAVNPFNTVACRTGACTCTPGHVLHGSPPDVAGLRQGVGPVKLVCLEPSDVHVSVELVGLVTPGKVVAELRDEAGHEDACLVSEEVVPPVVLMHRIGPVTCWLSG